ncbi:MAG: M28 family peptidase [Thermoleophilaceae bacterium]
MTSTTGTTGTQTALLTEPELRDRIERWAAIEHGSASPGERAVASMLADELRGLGLDVRIEEEQVHGGYWLPVGIPTAVAAVAGVIGGAVAFVAGFFGAAAVADDVNCARFWFRRRFLRRRTTHNVIAELGPADAERTLVFIAHHDAPHAGIVFHPEIPRGWARRFPKLLAKANTTPPTMWGAFFGPLGVALGALFGARRLRLFSALVSAGYAAAMADIGLRSVVAGANDNLSGVAAQMSLASALAHEPPETTRVILLFPGSEESFQEGMHAWWHRHRHELPRESTLFVNHETVGSPLLVLLEGEGMLGITDYPDDFKRFIRGVADELGIFLYPRLRTRNSSDSLLPLRAGYKCALFASCDELKAPTNYHWYTDVPENLHYGTIADMARLSLELTRRLAPARPA